MAATACPNCPCSDRRGSRTALRLCVLGIATVLLVGCATWQAPEALDEAPWRARAVTEHQQEVRLSAAVLSAEESRALFGADVNATGIQPVWLEVQNDGPDMLWLLRAGADPGYFSPLEVAWSFHSPLGGAHNRAIDEHFDQLAFPNPIPSGARRAGVIFTNPHLLVRVLNVDLLGKERLVPFTLFLPVPDSSRGGTVQQTMAHYVAAADQDLDRPEALRAALERLPCCGGSAQGAMVGDPLNIVLIGQFDHIASALIRRGLRADRRAIDDRQLVFGRRPDIVGRMVGQAGVSPHWIRLWVAPFRYRGQPVFVGQTGRPIGGRLAIGEDRDLAVHPNVDEVRNYLIQDLLYSGGLARLGFVQARGGADGVQLEHTLEKGSYSTDGLRAVMFFVSRPVALTGIEILDWVPALELQEVEAAAKLGHGKP